MRDTIRALADNPAPPLRRIHKRSPGERRIALSAIRSFAEPGRSLAVIYRNATSDFVKKGEIEHRGGIARIGSFAIPANCL